MSSLLCSSIRASAQCPRLAVRTAASTTSSGSPIQQLFVKKIREYASKEKTAEGGLVGATEADLKILKHEEFNLQRRYGSLDTSDLGSVAAAKMDTNSSVFDADPLKQYDPFERMKQKMPKVDEENSNFMMDEVKLPDFLRAN